MHRPFRLVGAPCSIHQPRPGPLQARPCRNEMVGPSHLAIPTIRKNRDLPHDVVVVVVAKLQRRTCKLPSSRQLRFDCPSKSRHLPGQASAIMGYLSTATAFGDDDDAPGGRAGERGGVCHDGDKQRRATSARGRGRRRHHCRLFTGLRCPLGDGVLVRGAGASHQGRRGCGGSAAVVWDVLHLEVCCLNADIFISLSCHHRFSMGNRYILVRHSHSTITVGRC